MNCKTCKADCARRGENREKEVCPGFIPMTNADHIRSMTDEELCDFIVFHTGYRESAWSNPTYYNFLTGGDDTRANADADTLKWLKAPYKENEE